MDTSIIKKYIKSLLGLVYLKSMIGRKNRKLPLRGTYGQLNYIRSYSNAGFIDIKKYNDTNNIRSIREKGIKRIGFVLYTSTIWNVDELYHLLNNDPKFEAELILVHLKMKDEQSSQDMFDQTYEYFSDRGYSIKKAGEIDIKRYDVLFYLTIGYIEEKRLRINNIPLDKVVLYTSYSYMLSDVPSKLNAILYHVSYCYYTDSEYYKECIEKTDCYTGNAKYLGFPKMDQFYNAKSKKNTKKKVIIYAPHHSVHRSKMLKSATFDENYQQILELAKKYSDSTYWIYKPHPSLRSNSVAAGIFSSLSEYDEYENKWRRMINAEVVSRGDYFSVFKESDAMITDSVSFLAEYQFTHKPLLLLESGKSSFNDFGKMITAILYKCQGSRIEQIEQFVVNVIDEIDPMKEKRRAFFNQYLDYTSNGDNASQNIYKDIDRFSMNDSQEKLKSTIDKT